MNIIQKRAKSIDFGEFKMAKVKDKWMLIDSGISVVPFIIKEGKFWIHYPSKYWKEAERKAMNFKECLKLAKEYREFLDTCEVF